MAELLFYKLKLLISRNRELQVINLVLPADMDDVKVCKQCIQIVTYGLIHGGSAERTADDKQNRLCTVKTADFKALAAAAVKKFIADRCPCQDCFVRRKLLKCLRKIAADLFCRRNADFVGKSRRHVRLMDNAWDVKRCCRTDHRHTDIAALGKQYVRLIFFQKFSGLVVSADDTERIREILRVKIPAELAGFDSEKGDPAILHQLLLDSGQRADVLNFISGFPERWKQCDIWCHMSGCSAAGEDDFFLCHGCGPQFFSASACSSARASWSAQEVGLKLQVLPFRSLMTSSAFCPSTSFPMALRLPLHPPVKTTLCTLCSSSTSKLICVEHVPNVL